MIGQTGSGKTTCGLWLLSKQRFDRRPWFCFDLKREPIFDQVGMPPIEEWSINSRPPKGKGLYLASPLPNQKEAIETFLWRCFDRGNIGIYVDEASLMPDGDAFTAILQQGRSKRIPTICCTQRPVNVIRPVFSEASYFCVYRLADKRDYRTVEGFVPARLDEPLRPFNWRWYDVARNRLLTMGPVPPPAAVAEQLRQAIPHRETWHPFSWTSRTTGRPQLKLVRS